MSILIAQSGKILADPQCVVPVVVKNPSLWMNAVTTRPKCKPCVAPVSFPCCTNCFSVTPPVTGQMAAGSGGGLFCASWSFSGLTTFPIILVNYLISGIGGPDPLTQYVCAYTAHTPVQFNAHIVQCTTKLQYSTTTMQLTFVIPGAAFTVIYETDWESSICNINDHSTFTLMNQSDLTGFGMCPVSWPSTLDVTCVSCS